MLHAGAAENKLNRLPSLKDVKLFHPVQLTPPVRVFDAARRNESPNINVPKVPGPLLSLFIITDNARYNGCTCSTLRISGTQVHVRRGGRWRIIGKDRDRRRRVSREQVERGAKRTVVAGYHHGNFGRRICLTVT